MRSKLKNSELKNRKLKTRHCPLAGGSLAPEPPTRSGEDPVFSLEDELNVHSISHRRALSGHAGPESKREKYFSQTPVVAAVP